MTTLATIPRHTRATCQAVLGVSRQHMARLADRYCAGRRLLSDNDLRVLRDRRTRPTHGPPATKKK